MNYKEQEEFYGNTSQRKAKPQRIQTPDSQTTYILQPSSSPTNKTIIKSIHQPFYHKDQAGGQMNLSSTSQRMSPRNQKYKIGFQNVIIQREGRPSKGLKIETSLQTSFDNSQSRIILHEIREGDQNLILKLQDEIKQKEQIIGELKNIIRLSHQNSLKNKMKTSTLEPKSPQNSHNLDQLQKELKQLKHTVKILTIENSTLSDYIQKQKQLTMPPQTHHFGKTSPITQHQNLQKQGSANINHLLRQKERYYEQKIDQFISSHKSLAQQCQKLQAQKANLQKQNQRLIFILKESQQSLRKTSREELQPSKNSSQKFSIQKIKQQYNLSLKQFKQTVYYQILHNFEYYKSKIQLIAKLVGKEQSRLLKLQSFIQHNPIQKPINAGKKQEIYIQEGVDSQVSQNSVRSKQSATVESVLRDLLDDSGIKFTNSYKEQFISDRSVVTLQDQVVRLKQVINELQSKFNKRHDYYTFRQKQQESFHDQIRQYQQQLTNKVQEIIDIKNENQQIKNELLLEIDQLKVDINRLETTYEHQKVQIHNQYQQEIYQRDQKIIQMQAKFLQLSEKYDKQVQRYNKSKVDEHIQDENVFLKKQLRECLQKIEHYNKIMLLISQPEQQKSIDTFAISNLKKQIRHLQTSYNLTAHKLASLQSENNQLIKVIKQLESKFKEVHVNNRKAEELTQRQGQRLKCLQIQKIQLRHKIGYLENSYKIVEQQLKTKRQVEKELLNENENLQTQIITNFTTFAREKLKESQINGHQKQLEKYNFGQITQQLHKLQSSIEEMKNTDRQSKLKISDLISRSMQENQPYEIQFKEDS